MNVNMVVIVNGRTSLISFRDVNVNMTMKDLIVKQVRNNIMTRFADLSLFQFIYFDYFSICIVTEVECDLDCQNGGICAKDHKNESQCFCPPGWSGETCETSKKIFEFRTL